MSEKRKYDSTVARIAGNIASGRIGSRADEVVARECVALARAIVAEVERTEPQPMTMTAALCTCQMVKQCSWASIDPNCPIHGKRGNISVNADRPSRSIDG